MKQNNNSFYSENQREIDKLDKRKIGIIISQKRKANNLTQAELAEKLGLSFQAVSNWECGNSLPDLSNVLELSNLFNISIDELLGKEHTSNTVSHKQNKDDLTQCDIDVSDTNANQKNTVTLDKIIEFIGLAHDDDTFEDIIYDWLENHCHTVEHIIELHSLDIPCVCDIIEDYVRNNPNIYSFDDICELYENDIIGDCIEDLLEAISDKELTRKDISILKTYLGDCEIVY